MSKANTGSVCIVGAGPGNPQLLTLRAVECLRQADVILHDRLIPKEVLHLFAPQARFINVGKKASFHTLAQDEIEDLLIKEAKKGQAVVRLKGGDPFIFGRGGEECERLSDEGISFEVVPGVSSALSVPLYAGIPLTHRKYATEIAIVTGHENPQKPGEIPYQSGKERMASSWVDWPSLAKMGTIVFLMGVGNIRANMKKLQEHGKLQNTPVAVIRWGGLGKQKTVLGSIDNIADLVQQKGLKAPAIIVVGGVVGLSEKLNWFEKQPLYGKTFLITRDVESNQKLAQQLLEKSAHVISWPSFEIVEASTSKKIKVELQKISKYDWLIFTSVRGVTYFLNKYFKIHEDFRPLLNVKIAAVGKETAKKLKEERLWVDLVAKNSSVKGLLRENVFKRKKNLKIFMPQANDARDDFVTAYAKRHKIFSSIFYRKKFIQQDQKEIENLKNKRINWILFYSPSAVESFLANFKNQDGINILKKTKLAVIGKTTEEHLKYIGLNVTVVAKTTSTEQIFKQVESFSEN